MSAIFVILLVGRKKTGFSPEQVFTLLSPVEIYDFIKVYCFESSFEKELVKGLRLFFSKAPDNLKDTIFLSATEHSPLNYLSPEFYQGSWDARLSSGQPLFFKLVRNKIFNAQDFGPTIRSFRRKSPYSEFLSFKDGEQNIAEFILECFLDWPIDEFTPSEHVELLKEILRLGDMPAFKNSQFLKGVEEEQLLSLRQEHFELFKARWVKEKHTFLKEEIPEVVRKFIRSFASLEIAKEFKEELGEIEKEHGGNLLDALEIFPLDLEKHSPEKVIREFQSLGLGVKSQDLMNDFIYPDPELDEFNAKTFPLIYPLLSRVIALEPGNLLYINVPYLESLALKAHPENGFLPNNLSFFISDA